MLRCLLIGFGQRYKRHCLSICCGFYHTPTENFNIYNILSFIRGWLLRASDPVVDVFSAVGFYVHPARWSMLRAFDSRGPFGSPPYDLVLPILVLASAVLAILCSLVLSFWGGGGMCISN